MNPMHGCIAWMIPPVSSPSAKALELASEALQVTGGWGRPSLCFFTVAATFPGDRIKSDGFSTEAAPISLNQEAIPKRRRSPDEVVTEDVFIHVSDARLVHKMLTPLWSFLVSRFGWERRCN